MTSMISKLKDSLWFKHYVYNCKSNSRIWIVLTVLSALGFPLFMVSASAVDSSLEALMVIAVMSQAAACASGIFLVYGTFNYLYNKSLVDMAYSAPLTTAQRFWSHLCAGLTVYLTPYLGSSVLGLIIGQFTLSDDILEQFPMFPTMLRFMVLILLAMLMLYAMTVLVVVCCGRLFEGVAYTLILNAVIPVAIAITLGVVLGDIYGLDINSAMIDSLAVSSPFGVVLGAFTAIDSYGYVSVSPINIWSLRYLLPILLVIAGLLALSFLLYKRRKAEYTGRTFVYKLMYYVLITGVTYCVIALFMGMDDGVSDGGMFLSALILSAIIYFIAEVITNRGFKKLGWAALRYALTVIASAVIVWTLTATELFGLPYRIPSANSIQSVSVDYGGYYDGMDMSLSNRAGAIRFTDPADVQAVLDLHNILVENYQNGDYDEYSVYYYGEGSQEISFSYNLKFGGTMSRQYRIPGDMADMLKQLDSSEEFRRALAEQYTSGVADYNNAFIANIYYGDDLQIYGAGSEYQIDLNVLMQNLYQDIVNESEQEYYNPAQAPICSIRISGERAVGRNFYIKAGYTSTLEYLRAQGLGGFLDTQASNSALPEELYGLYLIAPPEGLPDAYTTLTGDVPVKEYAAEYNGSYPYTSVFYQSGYFDSGLYPQTTRRLLISDKVRKLLSVAQPVYRSETPCYVIGNDYTGKTYLIPPEYEELAAEVFASEDAVEVTEQEDIDEAILQKYKNMGIVLEWDSAQHAYRYYEGGLEDWLYVDGDGDTYLLDNEGNPVYVQYSK